MSETTARQSIFSRVFWFAVGGFLSVGVNWSIFYVFRHKLDLPVWVALGISLTAITTIFSVWNYFVNFRTGRAWHECLYRYFAAIAFCYVLNYVISLSGIKGIGHTKTLEFAVITAVQILVSGVKFLLYHFWVYPHASGEPAAFLDKAS